MLDLFDQFISIAEHESDTDNIIIIRFVLSGNGLLVFHLCNFICF